MLYELEKIRKDHKAAILSYEIAFHQKLAEVCRQRDEYAEVADYQKINTGTNKSQLELVEQYELSEEEFIEIYEYCEQLGISFLSTAFDKKALKILKSKKNLRLIDSSKISFSEVWKFNSLDNFTLMQSEDKKIFSKNDFRIVSKRQPSKSQLDNLMFAFNVCRYTKSNAIVLASNKSTIGIGSGQPSRLDSCEIAINKMNKFSKLNNEIVAASDAFFPFVDGIETLVQAGVEAIIQPSGSIRDKEVINFANKTNTILVFSKTRHFKH